MLFSLSSIAVGLVSQFFTLNNFLLSLLIIYVFPLPIALCIGIGYYVRSLRMALLFGAFVGLMYHLSGFVVRLIAAHRPGVSHVLVPFDTDFLRMVLFASAILAVLGATISLIKNGRRTIPDKNSNR